MEIHLAWLCLILPFIGVLLTPIFALISPRLREFGAVFFSFLTAVSAVLMLPALFAPEKLPLESMVTWLETPMHLSFGVLLDPLSIIVANVVAVISFFIMVYCLGYMKGSPSIMRFWMLMNAFIGSMLLLVLANNLIIVFIGWKLVGLCSYGLISFYFQDQEEYWIGGPAPEKFTKPTECGLKALITTSVGDMLMLGGLLIIYYYSGTLNVLELYNTAPEWISAMAATPGLIVLVSVLLIAGPLGKSAQFPLHEWLPEAMSGPGPVSALIHAATMVKSGVFFIARMIPIFYYAYWTGGVEEAIYFFHIVAWVGAITAFLAASQGLVALELKKVLAYSTVSQIGFMMLGLGVAGFSQDILIKGYSSGIFHLMSHAMFKACLFLCAGTVIHAAHSIYIHEMGSMRKYLPFTWIFMTLAGLSLIGIPPLPGFWSKEAVLVATLEAEHFLLFGIAVAAVVFTAFYTMRFLGMVFHGQPSKHIQKESQKPHSHLHEAYFSQTFACGVLAAGIVIFGLLGMRAEYALNDLFQIQLVSDLGLATVEHAYTYSPLLVVAFSLGSVIVGIVPAYMYYAARRWDPDTAYQRSLLVRAAHSFFWQRWYIDKFYNRLFANGVKNFATSFITARCEKALDVGLNYRIPRTVSQGGNSLLDFIRADARDMSSNVTYLLLVTLVLLTLALVRMVA